jgi:multicomponent Na+:H+ antiporter subunit G
MVRLPDVYTRIHASGKVATLGVLGLLLGTAFFKPEIALKAIILMLFLLITSPAAAHAVALAAHLQGIPRVGARRDDLGEPPAISPEILNSRGAQPEQSNQGD